MSRDNDRACGEPQVSRPLDPVVVVIATRSGREDLLLGRALPSVFAQAEARPAAIVVVDDDARCDNSLENAVAEVQARCHRHDLDVRVVPNARTRRMSGTGAWNTGADLARCILPSGGWLAVLDDDDAWRPSYLRRCVDAAMHDGAALVVSGLIRLDHTGTTTEMAPRELHGGLFLVSNPGIQGSNLFIDLGLFEASGGFDETLASATDRDLLIRVFDQLAERPRPIARVDEHLVEHYAHDGVRVTTDPAAKRLGLDAFYARHRHRMDAETLAQSLSRARHLFGYEPT